MYPKLIALCGHPKAGKSEVQKILEEFYGHLPVDDGLPMRSFCVHHLGMRWDDVQSQAGKAGYVEILGKRWQRRDILGQLGNVYEDMFGADIMPFMACIGLDPDKNYSFGSVRRDQGAFYKSRGGLIIGIRNPLAQPSPYEFDRFNEELVDIWIENDAQAQGLSKEDGLLDLGIKVSTALSAWRARQVMQKAAE
jgi:hypothetical protein